MDHKPGSRKFEILSTKYETNPKDQNPNVQNTGRRSVSVICVLNFHIVSDFEIRISDLAMGASETSQYLGGSEGAWYYQRKSVNGWGKKLLKSALRTSETGFAASGIAPIVGVLIVR